MDKIKHFCQILTSPIFGDTYSILGFVIIGGSLNGNAPGEIANWPVTGAGLAVLSSSIFFYALQIKQTKKGIHHYNQGM